MRKLILSGLLLLLSACATTPKEPGQVWLDFEEDPNYEMAITEGKMEMPTGKLDLPFANISYQLERSNWSLPELVDLALNNNVKTRGSWLQTKSVAAALGSARGAYLPDIYLGASYSDGENLTRTVDAQGNKRYITPRSTVKNAYADLDFVIFDFGQRTAAVMELRNELMAVNYLHNATLQDVILQVQQSYYGYIGYKSLAKSQELAVKEATTNYNAAKERQEAGLATIADVLQAKTALSNAQLDLTNTLGQMKVVKGTLAIAVGLPPTSSFDTDQDLQHLKTNNAVTKSVEELMSEAEKISPIWQLFAAEYQKQKIL